MTKFDLSDKLIQTQKAYDVARDLEQVQKDYDAARDSVVQVDRLVGSDRVTVRQ